MADEKINYACVVIPPKNQIALVIRAMAEGFSVKQMREQGLLKSTDNPFLWGQLDPLIGQEIEMAQRAAGQLKADEIIDIVREEFDAPTIKAKVQAHQWIAEKYTPHRFGNKPLPPQKNDEISKMTKEELQAKKAEVLERLRQGMEKDLNTATDKEKDMSGGRPDRRTTGKTTSRA
jgi:hypothetical protein